MCLGDFVAKMIHFKFNHFAETLSIFPTRNIYEHAPTIPNAPINTRAGLKFPPLAKYPITIGTTIDAKLPMKLKTPPVNPIKCLGDNIETKTQEIKAIPAPKKASDMKKITMAVSSV